MRDWATYAGTTLVVVAGAAAVVTLLVGSAAAPAVWVGAAVAYLIQLVAFGLLVRVRGQPERFVVAWGAGTVLRFALVVALGLWATMARSVPFEPAPLLLSVVGFVVLLALLEPVFLNRDTSRK
ncbi:MAG: hypothetical protein FWJ74_05130 [Gemmatimonadota bacterium]